jgi:leader peptidase (prepilin peptidase) / N-methyltransferase
MSPQVWFWTVVAFLGGITIGSFLNAVIYRLPRNLSMLMPKHSICPNCNNTLAPIDLIPLLSFLALGRKCRQCKQPISWRYFNVELLTGALFVALVLRFPQPQDAPNCIALLMFTTVMIPIFFIDLATFHIPASLNILAFLIPLGRDVWGIVKHEPGHAPLWGWLPPSLLGALVGVLIFGTVRVAGWLWKRREAMGLGDVLLARGMGAMLVSTVPPQIVANGPGNLLRLFPLWVIFACLSGIIVGLIMIRLRPAAVVAVVANTEDDAAGAEIGKAEDDNSSLLKELGWVGYCLVLGDLWQYLDYNLKLLRHVPMEPEPEPEFTPDPSAIPFGPFMVIGFLATVFCGEALTAWYLAYALPKPDTIPPNSMRPSPIQPISIEPNP